MSEESTPAEPTAATRDERPPESAAGGIFRELLQVAVLALALYIVVNIAVQTVHVVGHSMQETLQDNDYLVACKVCYRVGQPQRGDIVIFKPSTELVQDYVKRIIAIPGDHLRIQDAQVFLNGHRLHEPYLRDTWVSNTTYQQGQEITLASDAYFVMGDNRNNSLDSRVFGPQTGDRFLGSAMLRVWPFNSIRTFSPISDLEK